MPQSSPFPSGVATTCSLADSMAPLVAIHVASAHSDGASNCLLCLTLRRPLCRPPLSRSTAPRWRREIASANGECAARARVRWPELVPNRERCQRDLLESSSVPTTAARPSAMIGPRFPSCLGPLIPPCLIWKVRGGARKCGQPQTRETDRANAPTACTRTRFTSHSWRRRVLADGAKSMIRGDAWSESVRYAAETRRVRWFVRERHNGAAEAASP